MANNQLIYKVVPTLIENGVEFDLPNTKAEFIFNKKEVLEGILGLSLIFLPGPTATLLNVPFIELIASAPVDLRFTTTFVAILDNVTYLSGNLKGHTFQLTNPSLDEISFIWKIYTNE